MHEEVEAIEKSTISKLFEYAQKIYEIQKANGTVTMNTKKWKINDPDLILSPSHSPSPSPSHSPSHSPSYSPSYSPLQSSLFSSTYSHVHSLSQLDPIFGSPIQMPPPSSPILLRGQTRQKSIITISPSPSPSPPKSPSPPPLKPSKVKSKKSKTVPKFNKQVRNRRAS